MDYDYNRYPKLGFSLAAKKSELTAEQWETRKAYMRTKHCEYLKRVKCDPIKLAKRNEDQKTRWRVLYNSSRLARSKERNHTLGEEYRLIMLYVLTQMGYKL